MPKKINEVTMVIPRRFVIGDIHGQLDALKEVFDKVIFEPATDRVYLVGDIVDGGPDTKGCVDFLLTIPNLVFVKGNHDQWFINFLLTGTIKGIWYCQGGKATLESYGIRIDDLNFNDEIDAPSVLQNIPEAHKKFFLEAPAYHVTEDNNLVVHGGIKPEVPLEKQDEYTLLWDRDLYYYARERPIAEFKTVFLGHTGTSNYGFKKGEPIIIHNYVNLDTDGGWGVSLTMMDMDTKRYVQSNKCRGLR